MRYREMDQDTLFVQRLLHNIPMPVEKIALDKEWRERYVSETPTGFYMNCHLIIEGMAFPGIFEIGFAHEDPNLIVHRYFNLRNK